MMSHRTFYRRNKSGEDLQFIDMPDWVTVSDLINALQQLPPEAKIAMNHFHRRLDFEEDGSISHINMLVSFIESGEPFVFIDGVCSTCTVKEDPEKAQGAE